AMLAAQTHAREIQKNQYPGISVKFRPGIDEIKVVPIHSVAGLAKAVETGNVAYLAYFGHAGVVPGSGENRETPTEKRTGPGALWIGSGTTAGANLTSRGSASDRPATDIPKSKFTSDAEVRLFGCRAGLGKPSAAKQLANALGVPVYAYTSSGGALYT